MPNLKIDLRKKLFSNSNVFVAERSRRLHGEDTFFGSKVLDSVGSHESSKDFSGF